MHEAVWPNSNKRITPRFNSSMIPRGTAGNSVTSKVKKPRVNKEFALDNRRVSSINKEEDTRSIADSDFNTELQCKEASLFESLEIVNQGQHEIQ